MKEWHNMFTDICNSCYNFNLPCKSGPRSRRWNWRRCWRWSWWRSRWSWWRSRWSWWRRRPWFWRSPRWRRLRWICSRSQWIWRSRWLRRYLPWPSILRTRQTRCIRWRIWKRGVFSAMASL